MPPIPRQPRSDDEHDRTAPRATDRAAPAARAPAPDALVWDASSVAHPPPTGRGEARAAEPKRCPHCEGEYDGALNFCPLDGAVLRAPTAPAAREFDLVGQVVADRYQVIARLGAGGMGQVYLAQHIRMGRQCALKVLNAALGSDADAAARFDREASNASRITHPNVAAIYDFGESNDGLLYLAMEYVEGHTLSTVLARTDRLPPRRALAIAAQVADALGAAHTLGIAHRDLKPDNIMVTRSRDGSDCVKVVDFGIAKGILTGHGQTLTRTGVVIGTPAYMSPEQLAAHPVDGRSDIYSLGLVTCQLFAGALPFPGGLDAMLARLVASPRRLGELRPDVEWPDALQAVLDRALVRSPEERYQTVDDFRRDLVRSVEEWLGPASAERRSAGRARVRSLRTPVLVAGAASALVFAAAVLTLAFRGRGTNQMRPSDADVGGARASARPIPPALTAALPRTTEPPRRAATTRPTLVTSARPPDSASGTIGASPVAPAGGERRAAWSATTELARIQRLTTNGDAAQARRALTAIRLLMPRLATAGDSVEADYYSANAHVVLGDVEQACSALLHADRRASQRPELANAIRRMLDSDVFSCR